LPSEPHILASRLRSCTLVCAAWQGADRKGLLFGVARQLLRPATPLAHGWLGLGSGSGARGLERLGSGEKASGRALRGPAGYKWRKIHKLTTLPNPALSLSALVHAARPELPNCVTRTRSRATASQNPPAKFLHANAHTMSPERRKPHRHATPPSWVDPCPWFYGF
jgi:hypothetical protein